MKNVKIILTRKWPADVEARLDKHFILHRNPDDVVLSQKEILQLCQNSDILCPTISDPVNAELINALPDSIQLIASYGVGVEHIDLDAARARGIQVSNTPGTVVDDTADMAFGLMIATARRFNEGIRDIQQDNWQGFSLKYLVGQSVHHKTLGIIGLGDIGQAVARRARGFGMKIVYTSRTRKPELELDLGIIYKQDLDDLLQESDFVSLHCALTPDTHHLINENALSKMKTTAILINTARGPVVDERALIKALREDTIAGAGLDVYEKEPHVPKSLSNLDNTLLIPHLGTATIETRNAMGFQVMDNIQSFLETGQVINSV